MIKMDYHMHSEYSIDSYTRVEDMVKDAINKGFAEIVITDHIDFTYPGLQMMDNIGIAANVAATQSAKDDFAGEINVKIGVEFGIRPDTGGITARIADEFDFDFIIGSTHDYYGLGFHSQHFFAGKSKIEAYNVYFENMLATVKANDTFDVLGHLDYIERYPRNYQDKKMKYREHKPIIDEILITLISKGKGIEINTAGITYGLGRVHPTENVLRRYVELGGEIITVGSDAHRTEYIGQHFSVAYKLLVDLGVTHITSFTKRKPTQIKL
ncbi:MAG: histidinol-phosphatase HisJ family protein [Defluviitaleaceae bacterium]|nr:histidinol-phosphatase HisJ family protein [Defluviitaleaceae bacterium]